MNVNNNSPIQSTPTNYFQNVQDKYQKTIDTSPSYISRALAAIGQFFNAMAHSMAMRTCGAEPLEISRYSKDAQGTIVKLSPLAFAITTGAGASQISGMINQGAVVDKTALDALSNKTNDSKLHLLLMSNYIDPTSQTTQLMRSAQKEKGSVLFAEIHMGARVNDQSPKDGRTALSFACESGNTEGVQMLLNQGADIHLADKAGKTPLMYAAQKNNMDIMKQILNHKDHSQKNIDKADKDGNTALMLASSNLDKSGFKLLIEYGANRLITNKEEEGTLQVTSQASAQETEKRGNRTIANALDFSNPKGQKMIAEVEDTIIVHKDKYTLQARATETFNKSIGLLTEHETKLFEACQKGNVEAMKPLVKLEDVNLNKPNKKGFTPLMVAAGGGHKEAVQLLLDQNGIDVNMKAANKGGRTALMLAVANQHQGTTEILLANRDARQGLFIKDNHDSTAATIAKEISISSDKTHSRSILGAVREGLSGETKGQKIEKMVEQSIREVTLKNNGNRYV